MSAKMIHHRPTTLPVAFLGFALLLTGCATPVALPGAGVLPEPAAAVTQGLLPTPSEAPIPIPAGFAADWKPLKAGDRLITGITLTPVLAEVFELQDQGRLTAAIEKLDSAPPARGDPHLTWYAAALRTHLLNLAGRASEAELAAAEVSRLEIALRGSDLVARSLRGDARARLADFSAAIQDYQSVLIALGNWRFPTSYGGPPSNLIDLSLTTEARGRALTGLAFAYTMSGDHRRALPWALESERHMADVFLVSKHALYGPFLGRMLQEAYLGRAVNLAFIGTAMLALNARDEAASPYFQAAVGAFSAIGFVHGQVYVDALKALAYFRAGRIDDADRTAAAARALAAERGLVDFVWRIAAIQGEAQFADGRIADAERSLRLAQDAVDKLTGAISGDQEKRRFGVGKEDITYRLAQIGASRNSPEVIFADLERGRARAFVDLLANVALDRPDSGWSELQQLDARLSNLVRQVEAGANGVDSRPGAEFDALMMQRARLLERIRSSNPELADVRSVGTPDLDRLRAALGPDAAMLYFLPARGDDVLRLLLVTAGSLRLESLPVTARQFQEHVAALARSIDARDAAAQATAAERLSRALATERWRDFRLLHIVPSGQVHAVPWGILDIEIPVVIAPTGTWPLRQGQRQVAATQAVIVGDPAFGGRLTQLEGAREEAASIARHYEAKLLIGAEATEGRLRSAIGGGTDVLHFATHGQFDAKRPLRSAIYLADAVPLTAEHLFRAPLHGKTVVLSACETGIGKVEAGDDYLGLPRSFFLGGASAVLSSLWPVDDEGTREFMEHFHAEMKRGSLAQSWLVARNRLRQAGRPPWIYGAFMLSGTP